MLKYHDHPGQVGEEYRALELLTAGTDYFFRITDLKTGHRLHFRFCISGGFEDKYQKTVMAVADLYRAMEEENNTMHIERKKIMTEINCGEKISQLRVAKQPTTECKGIFWRANVSTFVSSHKSIETRKSLRLLKKMSCPGCETCEWIWEYLPELIWSFSSNDYIGDIEHGKIYTYQVNTTQIYEDPYPEIDNIEFVEVKMRNEIQ